MAELLPEILGKIRDTEEKRKVKENRKRNKK